MRAILIDPQTRTVSEVDYNGDYTQISELIEASYFDCVKINSLAEGGDTIFVDDEGLLNDKVGQVGMFRVDGDYPAYLAGKGLILGTDQEGESVATKLDLDKVRAMIAFGLPSQGQFWEGKLMKDEITFLSTGRHWPLD